MKDFAALLMFLTICLIRFFIENGRCRVCLRQMCRQLVEYLYQFQIPDWIWPFLSISILHVDYVCMHLFLILFLDILLECYGYFDSYPSHLRES